MEHEQTDSSWHQQFASAGLEPFFGRLLFECIARADACQNEQQRHEKWIEDIHHNILILRVLRVFTETTDAAKDAFVVVKINDVVKQHQKHRHPT